MGTSPAQERHSARNRRRTDDLFGRFSLETPVKALRNPWGVTLAQNVLVDMPEFRRSRRVIVAVAIGANSFPIGCKRFEADIEGSLFDRDRVHQRAVEIKN